MSALAILQNVTAIGFGNSTYFGATGGTGPYVFSVFQANAGGTINPNTGFYVAPQGPISTPQTSIDVIQVTDSTNAYVRTSITVGGALELFCDIIRNQMNLDSSHVYLWEQKIMQPTDSNLYVAVSVPMCKPFGNNISYSVQDIGPSTNLFGYRTYPEPAVPGITPFNSYSSYQTNWYWLSYQQEQQGQLVSNQSVNMLATVDVDIISRGPAARDLKEFVLMALQSVYSEQQQDANSFQISRLSSNFINLSNIDGASIPYRYRISFHLTYAVTNTTPVEYFNNFATPQVVVNS